MKRWTPSPYMQERTLFLQIRCTSNRRIKTPNQIGRMKKRLKLTSFSFQKGDIKLLIISIRNIYCRSDGIRTHWPPKDTHVIARPPSRIKGTLNASPRVETTQTCIQTQLYFMSSQHVWSQPFEKRKLIHSKPGKFLYSSKLSDCEFTTLSTEPITDLDD